MLLTTMKTACKSAFLPFIFCLNVAFCYPVKPLNERSTELSWQAWLLVDQSNRQNDLGISSRKITAKSIFVVPNFNTTTLPSCAEGYKSDSMGRCIKISKIDPERQLQFILENYLKNQFPAYDEIVEEIPQTQGPLQINIPLFGEDKVESDESSNIAIVLAPKKNFNNEGVSVKLDVKRNDNNEKFDVDSIAAISGVKPEDVKITTVTDLPSTITTMMTTSAGEEETTFPTSTIEMETTEMSTTTLPTTTTDNIETTTIFDEETLVDGDDFFFRMRI